MELYKGLPLRTIEAEDIEGNICVFGVTTESVDRLMNLYWECNKTPFESWIEEFDNSYKYAIPQDIFENAEDEKLIEWLNDHVDNIYLLGREEIHFPDTGDVVGYIKHTTKGNKTTVHSYSLESNLEFFDSSKFLEGLFADNEILIEPGANDWE